MTLVRLPCTLAELETAIHKYGDHHGFDVKVDVRLSPSVPAGNMLEVKDEKGED